MTTSSDTIPKTAPVKLIASFVVPGIIVTTLIFILIAFIKAGAETAAAMGLPKGSFHYKPLGVLVSLAQRSTIAEILPLPRRTFTLSLRDVEDLLAETRTC